MRATAQVGYYRQQQSPLQLATHAAPFEPCRALTRRPHLHAPQPTWRPATRACGRTPTRWWSRHRWRACPSRSPRFSMRLPRRSAAARRACTWQLGRAGGCRQQPAEHVAALIVQDKVAVSMWLSWLNSFIGPPALRHARSPPSPCIAADQRCAAGERHLRQVSCQGAGRVMQDCNCCPCCLGSEPLLSKAGSGKSAALNLACSHAAAFPARHNAQPQVPWPAPGQRRTGRLLPGRWRWVSVGR